MNFFYLFSDSSFCHCYIVSSSKGKQNDSPEGIHKLLRNVYFLLLMKSWDTVEAVYHIIFILFTFTRFWRGIWIAWGEPWTVVECGWILSRIIYKGPQVPLYPGYPYSIPQFQRTAGIGRKLCVSYVCLVCAISDGELPISYMYVYQLQSYHAQPLLFNIQYFIIYWKSDL